MKDIHILHIYLKILHAIFDSLNVYIFFFIWYVLWKVFWFKVHGNRNLCLRDLERFFRDLEIDRICHWPDIWYKMINYGSKKRKKKKFRKKLKQKGKTKAFDSFLLISLWFSIIRKAENPVVSVWL